MSASVVFYRFKAQKEPSTVQFEGTGISVWDLKKEILAENKLGKGADFDFAIYNADTNEEYSDDKAIVPRSTSVIARRNPPSRPGRGNAQYYMVSNNSGGSTLTAMGSGSAAGAGGRRGHVSKRFDGKEDPAPRASTSTLPQQAPIAVSGGDGDEASRLAAFFGSTNEQWKNTQEQMQNVTPVYFGGRGRGAGGPRPTQHSNVPDKPVPSGYVCYRCGQGGHWIQECPTNDKPEWDNKPRIKRTTGIPKSFLHTVEAPSQEGENQPGVMVTAEGTFVVARPDAASWEKHRTIQANLTKNDVENLAPTDPDLTCSLCNRLLRDAVKTPCCSTSYCEECIQNYLSENDFVCPECESKIKSLKNLVKDEDRRTRAKKYLEDTLKASKEAGEAQDKDKASTGTNGDNGSSNSDPKSQTDGTSSESQAKSEDAGPAEEGELAGDEQTNDGAGRSISPNARSDGRSRADSSQPNGSGMPMMNNNMMQQQNGGNNGYSNMFNGMGNQISPQMQMLQTQITSTMNVLSSNSLPAQMRAQLTGQLQNLQYQYGQMMQMMQMNGAFGGQGNMMQQQMSAQMQQMQQMQQMSAMQQQRMMMMQGNGNFGGFGNGGMPMGMNMMNMNNMANMNMNGAQNYQPKGMSSNAVFSPMNNTTQFTGRHGSQFEADSSDSPYMRVPTNPKFKKGSQKRDRPEDFLELGHQQIRRL